jgi:hypothetical protein
VVWLLGWRGAHGIPYQSFAGRKVERSCRRQQNELTMEATTIDFSFTGNAVSR